METTTVASGTSLETRISKLEAIVLKRTRKAKAAKPVKAGRAYRLKPGTKVPIQSMPAKSQLVALYLGQQAQPLTQKDLVKLTRMKSLAVAGALASLINRGAVERVKAEVTH